MSTFQYIKPFLLLWLLCSLQNLLAQSSPIKMGDSPERVEAIMGKPAGYMTMDALTIYTYDLGTIRFKEDKVIGFNLITPEALALKKQQEAEKKAARIAQGEKIKAEVIADKKFLSLPAKTRADFWAHFRRDYPEVNVYVLYHQAQTEADQLAAQEREAQRIDDLERRVQQAEAAARHAQKTADTARVFNQTRYNNRYPYVVTTSPIIIRETHTRIKPQPSIYGTDWEVNLQLNGGGKQSNTTRSSTYLGYGQGSLIQAVQTGTGW